MSACPCCLLTTRSAATEFYTGPVPIVTHVHGHEDVPDVSDGYSEAWYMPNANLTGADGTTYSPVRRCVWMHGDRPGVCCAHACAWRACCCLLTIWPNHICCCWRRWAPGMAPSGMRRSAASPATSGQLATPSSTTPTRSAPRSSGTTTMWWASRASTCTPAWQACTSCAATTSPPAPSCPACHTHRLASASPTARCEPWHCTCQVMHVAAVCHASVPLRPSVCAGARDPSGDPGPGV